MLPQAAESRESRMAAELRESEVAVMERDELEAQVWKCGHRVWNLG